MVDNLVTFGKLRAADDIARPSLQTWGFSTSRSRHVQRTSGRAVLVNGRAPDIRLARLVQRHDSIEMSWNIYTVAVYTEKKSQLTPPRVD